MHPHTSNERPAPVIAAELQRAFDHFNRELFEDALPPVVLLFHRHPRSFGYFWPERFHHSDGKTKAHEIALNPDHVRSRTLEDALSTLVHEQVHLWQCVYGKKFPKKAYHNKEWASRMKDAGLYPSTTGLPGGKETGQKCSHYIIKGGAFAKSCERLISKNGFTLTWASAPLPPDDKKKKAGKRVKYTCGECEAAVWGKAEMNIECGDCNAPMIGEVPDEDESGE